MVLRATLSNMKHNVTTSMLTLHIIVTYYRIKYITDQHVVSDIVRNIAYADRSLERDAGANVPNKSNQVVCALYTLSFTLISIIVLYSFMNMENERKISTLLSESYSTSYFSYYLVYYGRFKTLEKCLALHSMVLVCMQFTFMLYLISQKLGLLQSAVLKKALKLEEREVARVSRDSCAVL